MLMCCRLLAFFKINFLKKKSFRSTTGVSNDLDPDQDRLRVLGGGDLLEAFSVKMRTDRQS